MFTQDTRTESFLSQMGVKYRYTNDLKISDLPKSWNVSNAGRPVALRESAVLEYACLMESGSAAPAPIIHRGEKIDILDGLQRLAAAIQAGFTRFSAYDVTCDSEDTLLAIRVLANVRLQGHAEPPEWTKRNAVQRLVIDRGMSTAEVAKMGGWRPSDIERLATVLDWGFHVRCIGGPQSLPDGIISKIAELTTKEELQKARKPIAAFLNTVHQAKLSTGDAEPYIEEFFRPSSTIDEYENRLEEFSNTPEVLTRIHGRESPGLSAGVNLRRSLKAAITILDRTIKEGEKLQYVDEFFQLIKKIDARLRTMAPHCKPAEKTRTPADKWAKR